MGKECYDHLGNRFSSFAEMCRHYNKKVLQVVRREKLGWSRERALTENVKSRSRGCTDHLGNKYGTVKEMCMHYGQDVSTYKSRRSKGFSIEDSLTMPRMYLSEDTDHLGNKYGSTTKMCDAYEIDLPTYINRRKKGWSLEDALTKDVAVGRSTKCKDTFGNEYESITELCDAYCVKYGRYKERSRCGWNEEECLGIAEKGLNKSIGNGETINDRVINIKRAYTGRDSKVYYKCTDIDTGEELILNADEILMYKQKDYKTAVEKLIQRRRKGLNG